jgi:hypothetical protein
MVHILPAT